MLTSGDELQAPDEAPLPGKIYDSNGPQLTQLLIQSGFAEVQREHRPAIIIPHPRADGSATPGCDLSTGGVSVGEEDHLRAVLEQQGQLDFWRLAIKPGKPPAAAWTAFRFWVCPAIRRLYWFAI